MTVEATNPDGTPIVRSGPYNGNGVTVAFNYTFPITAETELKVIRQNADLTETTLTLTTQYTVSGVGNAAGGQITLTSADLLPTGAKLVILLNMDYKQTVDYSNQGRIQLSLLETSLDRLTLTLRQLREEALRAITVDAFNTVDLNQFRANVNTLAPNNSNITTVAQNVSAVNTNATNIASINTTATNIASVRNASDISVYVGPFVKDVASLLADTTLNYTVGALRSVAAGDIVLVGARGLSYRVAASGATDHHVITAGGVKLYIADLQVTFEHYGAIGDGVADDTASMTAAFQGPHAALYARDGANYRFSPITGLNALLRAVVCEGRATFTQILATAGAVGLTVSNRQYFRVEGIKFVSSGTKADGNATVGLKFEAGCSIIEIGQGCEFLGHSGRGLQIIQCVHAKISGAKFNTAGYGLSLEKNGSVPCTVVEIEHTYISDGTRGISSDGTVGLTIIQPVFETCGATATTDGALHLIGGRTTIIDPYWENCRRDFVTFEAVFTQLGEPFKAGAAAADSHTFSGTAFADRGFMTLTPTDLRVRRIGPDIKSNNDLVIGTNLTAPVVGGSVNWGGDTMETIKGAAASGVWTVVKALAGQSGGGETRVSYRYAIYAGQSDKTTGYDTGRILNGVIRSDSGTLPAWLRINAGALEINIVSDTYGLNYGCVLQTTNAIN